jgi:hypothetical protein
LRAAIVLTERRQDRAALALAIGGIALQALQVGQHAIEIRTHLLNLIVDRAALLRLAAEQREEATAFAAQAPSLRRQPVELDLLALGGLFVTPDLLGALRISCLARSAIASWLSNRTQTGLRCDAPGGSGGCAATAVAPAAAASTPGISLRNTVRITVSFMEQSRTDS